MGDTQDSSSIPSEVILCDTFSLVPGTGSPLSLILTHKELLIQNLSLDAQLSPQYSLALTDCIGCRSFRGKDPTDLGGYFTAVFYPLRGKALGTTVYRQRVSRTFRAEGSRDKEQNFNVAQSWAKKIWEMAEEQEHPGNPLPSSCRFLVLLNPFAGTGKASALFQTHVIPMLTEANATFTLLETERPKQAYELVRDEDLSGWDAIVVMSGDGLVFEVINGLMERPDWVCAIKKPIAVLPGGSGNALAASISYYSGHKQAVGNKLLNNCTFILCKGQPVPLDLVSFTTSSGRRIFSFLSFAWGLISDVDIESERYRFMGSARFSFGTFVRLTALRTYRGRLSYQAAKTSVDTAPESDSHRRTLNDSTDIVNPHVLEDSLLVPLNEPVPPHWTTVMEDQFVLVLLLYQSHLGADLFTAPMVQSPGEGVMQLFYATSRVSRASLLKLFLAMEKGTHLHESIPHIINVPVTAFRVEPFESNGIMTVDGEAIPCCSLQGQIHKGLGRIISIPQPS
ncbi:sphingosine kinase 1 L homeolog [Xenopus laevis]|uniref:sphingosine kinase n=1 Tax=Xenopus laevis TaxID=8355 RepID=Q5U4T6_XENLA|nr:sphingosine kinase 1 L homeolog [Xenopus laevis]AAH84958.1 LOC495437 protein [Xenopus laevis]